MQTHNGTSEQKRSRNLRVGKIDRLIWFSWLINPFWGNLKLKHILDCRNNYFCCEWILQQQLFENNNNFSRYKFYYLTRSISEGRNWYHPQQYLHISECNTPDWNSNLVFQFLIPKCFSITPLAHPPHIKNLLL